ncbi:hypothetical protein Rsub_10172 [Raphidocelis subcapitata]|uniref:Uncharacterized protein n=1 Tax=Raphidocelis subcapitata TaxID=307507 RepID=A0A2V0PCJ6_9CHLO|nr:hypothetical protein Rsub_10172 [Raphidocelis subcapitata]|eukprot:GBF97571.1 hypothetical protein Rsub_10172 [Raphidocelis subcapitata]
MKMSRAPLAVQQRGSGLGPGARGVLVAPRGLARAAGPAAAAAAPRSRAPAVAVRAMLAPSTTNPAFTGFGHLDDAIVESRYSSNAPMTLGGTVNKTACLLALTVAAMAATWAQLLTGGPAALPAVMGATKIAGVVAMVAAIASMFKPLWSNVTGPVYALSKGIALGGVAAFAEMMAPGVAFNALLLTMSTAGSLLFALKSNMIQVTDSFSDTVRAVTGGFFISMLVVFALAAFGVKLPGLFSAGPIAMVVSLVSAGLAAANLLLDFDFARQAAYSKSVPRKLEWYFAQSTLFTLVWMFTSILSLLMQLAGIGGSSD